MIKYRVQFCFASICSLIDIASEYQIPVVLNSVGVEGYDIRTFRCQQLKKALQNKNVKYISVRDDLDTLVNQYLDGNPKCICKKVADPAVWISDMLNIQKSKSEKIGIGIGRGNLFKDYGKSMPSEDIFDFYCNLIRKLITNNKVELFTNGAIDDCEFAKKIQYKLSQEGINIALVIPRNLDHLVKTIATYNCILATRLHSCILAYSLDVPAIGFVWNDKLKLWGENIQAEDFFIDVENMKVGYVLGLLDKLKKYHYDLKNKEQFKNSIKDSIDEILNIFFYSSHL